MKKIIHRANTRGHADHGWLNTHHTFSFGNYQNAERMNFGVLRVLNDDVVSKGKGFGKHQHKNMEIVSIPLEGNLKHMDSMGNVTVIKEGDVQVMSAGTGIFHSEFNESPDNPVAFLQIWIIPNQRDIAPRYDQISLQNIAKKNELYQVLSPNKEAQGVWVYQNAWFYLGDYSKETFENYTLKDETNGIYAFVITGEIQINDELFASRDGVGFWEVSEINFTAKPHSRLLLMEVPMKF